jgi:hypothetical protein
MISLLAEIIANGIWKINFWQKEGSDAAQHGKRKAE